MSAHRLLEQIGALVVERMAVDGLTLDQSIELFRAIELWARHSAETARRMQREIDGIGGSDD